MWSVCWYSASVGFAVSLLPQLASGSLLHRAFTKKQKQCRMNRDLGRDVGQGSKGPGNADGALGALLQHCRSMVQARGRHLSEAHPRSRDSSSLATRGRCLTCHSQGTCRCRPWLDCIAGMCKCPGSDMSKVTRGAMSSATVPWRPINGRTYRRANLAKRVEDWDWLAQASACR